MVTIRTFASAVDAALAKSVLDDYEVPCVLLHEYANTYYPLAMPVRLVVPGGQADRAIEILQGDYDGEMDTEVAADLIDTEEDSALSTDKANRNPWELLMLAFYLLLPAVCLLSTRFPTTSTSSRMRYFIVRAAVTQFLGILEATFAVLLIVFYFRVRYLKRRKV